MGAFVGEKNFNVIKMHGTTIKKGLVVILQTLRSENVKVFKRLSL